MLTRNQTLGLFSGPIVRPEPALVFKTIHILAGFLQQHYFLLPGNPNKVREAKINLLTVNIDIPNKIDSAIGQHPQSCSPRFVVNSVPITACCFSDSSSVSKLSFGFRL